MTETRSVPSRQAATACCAKGEDTVHSTDCTNKHTILISSLNALDDCHDRQSEAADEIRILIGRAILDWSRAQCPAEDHEAMTDSYYYRLI